MDKKLNIILCASAHLPTGTSELEFEALYNTEIKPLILALDKFQNINIVFHYSGVILSWMEQWHPEIFILIEDLISRKQVEFLGGGFYAPVLPLLPLSDKIGQIEMLTTYLRKRFGKRPQGCWLSSMAWEQNLVGPLNSCGMSYTFLQDVQFSGTGIKPNAQGSYSPCVTEDQGKLITVFPLASELGRELRKGNAGSFFDEYLLKYGSAENNETVVIPLSGEALGESSEGVDYRELCAGLSSAANRLTFSTTAKIFKSLRGLKKTYFPGVWTPEHHTGNETHPRQFLTNYPEASGIYSKMIYVHTLVNNQLRGDKTRKRTALQELWKAQDSGVFRLGSPLSPGLLHSPVRKAAYRALLEAEKITREKGKFNPSLSFFDFDLDGEGEYVLQDDKLNCCVKTRGAGIFELDYLPAAWNYLDTMTSTSGFNDGGKRCAFTDWLAPASTLAEQTGSGGIPGGRFCGREEYEVSEVDRLRRRVIFRLPSKAGLPWGEIEIIKAWQLKKNSLALEYVLRNTGKGGASFTFSPSVDLSFPGTGEEFLQLFSCRESEKTEIALNGAYNIKNARVLEFHDKRNKAVITLEASRFFEAQIFEIFSGLPAMEEYQSTCIMPLLPVSLDGGKTWKVSFSLRIVS